MCIIKIVLETLKRTFLTQKEGSLPASSVYLKVGCLSQYFGLSLYAALSKEHFQRAIHCPSLRDFFVR